MPTPSQANYDYGKYSDIDWSSFARLLQTRLREEGKPTSIIADNIGWPAPLLSLVVRGARRPSPTRLGQLIAYLELSDDEIPRILDNKPAPKGTKVFLSYSHKDREYLERLMVHLRPLEKQGIVDPWVDTKLLAGDRWKKEIETALKQARIAVLLISADFLASDFIVDNELPPLLQAAEERGTLILPVILKPCRFTREPTLREFQAINPPDEPLSILDENGRELIYDTIAQRIEDSFQKKKG